MRRSTEALVRHSASDLLDIEALSADGLLVRSDGAFVRALDVSPSDPLVMGEAGCERMTAGFSELLSRVPAGLNVQLYAQADPVDLDVVLDEIRAQTDAATQRLVDDRDEGLRWQGAALRE